MKIVFLKYTAIISCAVLLFPIGISVNHVLENHDHKVCDNPHNIHFHEQTVDCSLYTFQINPVTSFSAVSFEAVSIDLAQQENFSNYSFTLTNDQAVVSLRAPPYFS